MGCSQRQPKHPLVRMGASSRAEVTESRNYWRKMGASPLQLAGLRLCTSDFTWVFHSAPFGVTHRDREHHCCTQPCPLRPRKPLSGPPGPSIPKEAGCHSAAQPGTPGRAAPFSTRKRSLRLLFTPKEINHLGGFLTLISHLSFHLMLRVAHFLPESIMLSFPGRDGRGNSTCFGG